MIQVPDDRGGDVLSVVCQDDDSKLFAAFDFSANAGEVAFEQSLYHGDYTDFESGEAVELTADTTLELPAWSYRVFTASD